LLSRHVRLSDGQLAHYVTAGESGPAVVLLHGGIVGSSGTAGWRHMATHLGANGFRVYCPDQPGFGLADTRPEFRPLLGTLSHVEFIDRFVTALGLERFHLGGNSMGCTNAVHYAVAHPERVESIAVIAGGLGDLVPVNFQPKLDPRVLFAFDGTASSMRQILSHIVLDPSKLDDEVIEMRTLAANRQRDSYVAPPDAARNIAENPDLAQKLSIKHRLGRLTIPMIYAFGREDALSPVEWAYDMEAALEHVQFFFPDDCGHQGQTDRPELFNALFLQWFRDRRISKETAEAAGISTNRPPVPGVIA
jgi:pimeloyl-ACP methyl ester carboxylesterase